MKHLFILLVGLAVISSCKDKKENPAPAGNRTDSIPIVNPEKTANPYASVDISPMDMSYFPVDYPLLKMRNAIRTEPLARVIYSRPHLQGRHIFHDVLKYGEPWRLGANESSELDLYRDAVIQGKKIGAGRYVIYCIPQPDHWTIVLNGNTDSWGLNPDPSKDIEKFSVPVTTGPSALEYFTMVFEKTAEGASLLMAWDNVEARLPIRF